MLRIQRTEEKGEQLRLVLSGRIEGAQVAELRRLIDDGRRHGAIVLDLKEVRLVDRDTVLFLARCESSGITLENASTYVREWIAREALELEGVEPSLTGDSAGIRRRNE